MSTSSGRAEYCWWKDALLTVGCLVLVLGFLFRESFEEEKVVFANDAPLGLIQAHAFDEKVGGWSYWQDLNWIGGELPSAMPNFTKCFFEFCLMVGDKDGAVLIAKWYQPVSLVLLGFCAWLFFRSLRFSQPVCILGALATALNGDFFSYTCWGLPSVALGAAGAFLAMAGVINGLRERGLRMVAWVVLGGLGLGQGVMESFDVGGIFSLYVALFVIMAAVNREGVTKKNLVSAAAKGVALLVVVVLASALMAWHALSNLLRTEGGAAISSKTGIEEKIHQLEQGVSEQLERVQADPKYSPAQKQELANKLLAGKNRIITIIRNQPYDNATQWSLPPVESLRMMVPGLYGYRENPHGWMNHPVSEGKQYWGRVGQTPGFMRIQKKHPQHADAMKQFQLTYGGSPLLRHGSSGIYMGLMVLVVSLWALLQVLRGEASVFDTQERSWVFFWAAAALVSLMLSWGHHAPFYKVIYQLPFFNVIRNPIKFMHPCSLSVVVLFAFGLQGMARKYIVECNRSEDTLKHWVQNLKGWDRKWVFGMLGMISSCFLAWLIFAALKPDLERELVSGMGFSSELASVLASGSLMSAGLAIVFLTVTVLGFTLFMSGVFSVKRSAALWGILGLLLCVDLAVGSRPHLVFFDWKQKYASNDVIDLLKERPFEQRASSALVGEELRQLDVQLSGVRAGLSGATNDQQKLKLMREGQGILNRRKALHQMNNYVYQTDWKQALFPFHRIHALDVIQEPRPDPRNSAYRKHLISSSLRQLELTSTRYLLGNSYVFAGEAGTLLGATNQFSVMKRFDLVEIPGRTNEFVISTNTNGLMALMSFKGALPRAGLFANWRSGLSDDVVLATLPRPSWDPHQEVLIAEKIPAPESGDTNATVMSARYMSYDPKHLVIQAEAETSTVLLLNDKHHPAWKVTVDGVPAKLLRANYLMRGVHLPGGKHLVEFRFEPDQSSINISLAGFGLGTLAFLGLLLVPKSLSIDEGEDVAGEASLSESQEEARGRLGDQQISKADKTSSKDEQRGSLRRKSRSRSGRRKKR